MGHRQFRLLLFSATLGASAIALGAVPALEPNATSTGIAKSAPGGVLEEIPVTARRRDESSMAMPMSLTVIDDDTLDGLQYRDIDQLLGLSPGALVYTGSDGLSSQILFDAIGPECLA
jgi:outer membrane receptor protein involved in Fe transport